MLTSVIICTYNRSELLEQSLRSVAQQDIPPDEYEIVVIDNNSTDHTKAVVQSLAPASRVRISYIFEERQGLSYARNCGIRSAKGEIVVFTDDDIEADPGWLRELVSTFSSPEVACVGGPIRPLWPFEKPQWLTRDWEGFLTISEFDSARETGFFGYPNYPWGANIAFRKSVFDTVGLFSTDLGRKGNSLLSNEELKLCWRIESAGYKIKFAPDAVIHHKIAPERISKNWLMHRAYWQGRSDAILDRDASPFSYTRLRDFGRHLFWHQIKDCSVDFTTRCIDRSIMGYLHQLVIAPPDPPISEFRKLRALKAFLFSFTSLLRATIADKKNQIEGLQTGIKERDRTIASLQEHLNAQEQRIAQQTQWLAERACDIQQRDQWLAERACDIQQRDQWLAEQAREIQQRDQWLAERDQDIQQRDQWLAERDNDIQQRDQLLTERNSLIQEFSDSYSWKITAPLRKLGSWVRQL